METSGPRLIAFYLPQFHPIPENDKWWGKGFTEWTNVGKAGKLYPGHYQPRVPADLGYYDLRVPETREEQAEMARAAGVEGFCYWHYWFGGGKRLLERPFQEVLASGRPDFPFCLAWANESWKGFAHGLTKRNVLIEQIYPGVEDYTAHFYAALPAFKDKRYIRVDNKPLFVIYHPLISSEIGLFIKTWRALAKENGLEGMYFTGCCMHTGDLPKMKKVDLDAVNTYFLGEFRRHINPAYKLWYRIYRDVFSRPYIASYRKAARYFFIDAVDSGPGIIPTIISGWDHSPRSGRQGMILHGFSPAAFEAHVKYVVENMNNIPNIVFLKSWNEWAEGNYVEPDLRWRHGFLDVLAKYFKVVVS